MAERIQQREKMFRSDDASRFTIRWQKKSKCLKLVVNGIVISDRDELLDVWTQHFSNLSKSRSEEVPELQVHKEKIASHIASTLLTKMLFPVKMLSSQVIARYMKDGSCVSCACTIFNRPLTLYSIRFCWRDCLRWASMANFGGW